MDNLELIGNLIPASNPGYVSYTDLLPIQRLDGYTYNAPIIPNLTPFLPLKINYTPTELDYVLNIQSNDLVITLLETFEVGKTFIIKVGNFNNCLIQGIIDGLYELILNDYECITLTWTGVEWAIINFYSALPLQQPLEIYSVLASNGYPVNGTLIKSEFNGCILFGNDNKIYYPKFSNYTTTGQLAFLDVNIINKIYPSTGLLILNNNLTINSISLLLGDNGNVYIVQYDGTVFQNANYKLTPTNTPATGYILTKLNAQPGNANVLFSDNIYLGV